MCVRAIATTIVLASLASAGFEQPRFKSGTMPVQPRRVTGWGQVFLEVGVDQAGRVDRVNLLSNTPPFGGILQGAVRPWQFAPATEDGRPVPSRVLVAAVFRPAALFDNPTQGTPPQDLALASDAIPLPIAIDLPRYPPTALGDGIVLVEVRVGSDGLVNLASVVSTPSGFDESAIQAARRWRFRPATRAGGPIAAFAYLLFGFRAPVISPHTSASGT